MSPGQDYPQLRTNVELIDPGAVEAEGKRRPVRARMGCCPGRDAHTVGRKTWLRRCGGCRKGTIGLVLPRGS